MSTMASQITSVYSAVYSGADQRKHQSSASLAFVRGIHRSPVNSPHKGPVTRKMSPFDDVIMNLRTCEMEYGLEAHAEVSNLESVVLFDALTEHAYSLPVLLVKHGVIIGV